MRVDGEDSVWDGECDEVEVEGGCPRLGGREDARKDGDRGESRESAHCGPSGPHEGAVRGGRHRAGPIVARGVGGHL
eukprot:scaffold20629_cov32-Tisochrysis_lutea.AAC.3